MKERRLPRKTMPHIKWGQCSLGTRLRNCLDSPTMQIFRGISKMFGEGQQDGGEDLASQGVPSDRQGRLGLKGEI
jgi:hypothetical protein